MARKNKDGGVGLAVLAVVGVFLAERCSNTTGVQPKEPAPIPNTALPASSTATMYVASASLNCRTEPNATASISEKLSFGDAVDVGEVRQGWAAISGAMGDCWATQRFLSEDKPEMASSVAPSEAPSPEPVSARSLLSEIEAASGRRGSQCGSKWKCGQMNSCDEAYHYLNDCGVSRLDGDGDGVPCESICG